MCQEKQLYGLNLLKSIHIFIDPTHEKTLNYFTGNQKKISEENFLLFNCLERIGRNQQFFQSTKKKRGIRKILLTSQRLGIFEMVVGS